MAVAGALSGAVLAQGRGLDYLCSLRQGLPKPELVSLMLHPHRDSACAWIGEHFQSLNAALLLLLLACDAAVAPHRPPDLRLFAAPLDPRFELDGFCCLPSVFGPAQPTRILLDLGVLDQPHWLALLAHEYAHALVAAPGHDWPFQQALTTLCQTLHLDLHGDSWPTLPRYPRRTDRLAFWRGL